MLHPNYPRLGHHRLDPPELHAAAQRAGEFIANNPDLTSFDEWLPILIEQATKAGYRGNLLGLQARLSWAMRDAAQAVRDRRTRVQSLIRRMAWPAMDALTPAPTIAAQAAGINHRDGEPLTADGVRAVLDEIAAQWLRRRNRRHG